MQWEIEVPASVEEIGERCFRGSRDEDDDWYLTYVSALSRVRVHSEVYFT